MKNAQKPKLRKFRKRVLLLKAAIPVLLLFFGWQFSGKLIYARKLECYTQYGNCPAYVNDQVQWLINYPLLKPLPVREVREKLKTFPEIKSVFLYRRLPSTLVLSVMLSKPVGLVGQQILGVHAIADSDGRIIGETSESVLPLLLVDEHAATPEAIVSSRQLETLKLLDQVSSVVTGQVVGQLNDREVTVKTPGNTNILFNLDYLPENWPATLQLIFNRSKILSQVPKVIDLRFSSPTVTF